jgi:diguanylate cyclase (GGDEF)-like protein
VSGSDDLLTFLSDDLPDCVVEDVLVWKILVVDDDEDVHQATEFALGDVHILGRPLSFLHAHSCQEALAILGRESDIAVVLLDVVMESDDAGLTAVSRIRQDLKMQNVRIILRTGQPGYAPELEAITQLDINDYKTKSELTRNKLYTTLTAAIRSYDQIVRLDANQHGLALILDGTKRLIGEQSLQAFAADVLIQVAALCRIPPDGVICVSARGAGEANLLAAGGRYQGKTGFISALGNDSVIELLTQCFDERKHQFGDRSMALFLAGSLGQEFVVYIESDARLSVLERHLLDVFCANITICGDNVGLLERLRNTAYVDRLTGLPNRVAQIEMIDHSHAQSQFTQFVLALVDVDQFSETIDIFGYRFGDLLLQSVAHRLRASLPPDVHVARVGGDVFGVFGAVDVVNPAILREILFDPFPSEAGVQALSFSIGMVLQGEPLVSGADLLRNAAIALKRAKVDGTGNEAYYTAEVAVQTRERVRLLQDLRRAFDSRRLFVVYQPQVDLLSGRVIGIEALLRWRDHLGNYIPPDHFIPVAEQSGLIIGVGGWVLRTAIATQCQLAAAGFPLRMAVNVSAIQFRHPDFIALVENAISESGIDPAMLELEITESVAMLGWTQVQERLEALKKLSISVAIDDFGTGFSSLSYLDRLPADCLKIDRAFVAALGGERSGHRIAEMVIELGKRLGMRVLAEGVEEAAQVETLRALGCHEAQGWFYAKGMPENELLDWLGRH